MDVVDAPPDADKYGNLKQRLLELYCETEEAKNTATPQDVQDERQETISFSTPLKKPGWKQCVGGNFNVQMPSSHEILIASGNTDLATLALIADQVTEYRAPHVGYASTATSVADIGLRKPKEGALLQKRAALVAADRRADPKSRCYRTSRITESAPTSREEPFQSPFRILLQFDGKKHGVLLLPPTFRSASLQMRHVELPCAWRQPLSESNVSANEFGKLIASEY